MYRMLATLTLVGLLLVITTAANASSALHAPIVPRAPDREHYLLYPDFTRRYYWDIFHGGTLTEDTTLLASGYPYVINEDIVVPPGITLTIEPGVTLQFQAGRSLRVEEGRLLAEGTPSQPIVFTRHGTDPWGAVVFQNSAADNRIAYATVEYAGAADNPYWKGISAYYSTLCVEHSTIRHLDGWNTGVYLEGSEAQVLDNVIHDVGEDGIHIVWGDVVVRGNHVYNAYEGIELEFMVTPAVLLDNHVHDIADDCIDLDASAAVVERNELHHCGDKGISVGYPSSTTLVNNLVYATREGIAIEDGAVSRIVNNTVTGNQIGIGLHSAHEQDGGFATLVNCIVWDNGIGLEVRDGSVITVTHSNVKGGWPGEGNINADPLFRAPQGSDYRPLENSLCVDTGTPVGAPDEDIQGGPRPWGRGYDLGAHELNEFFSYLPLVLYNYPPAPPLYRLYADPDDLDWLADQNPYQDETIPATFCAPPEAGGVRGGCWDVDIRYRGDTARLMPKKCWKIFFPGSDLFQGQGELNLNADYVDQTLLRSYVGYDLFTRADVPAPRAGHARLYINDEYYGLFSQVEQVDERFLHRLGIEMHGNLYKPFYGNLGLEESDWWYWEHYPKKTNRQSGHEDLVAFIELINNTPDEQFPDAITEVLDVNGWLDWYAVNILIGNFEMTNKNHYLYHDSSTGRWMILPWDVDISFGHNEGNPYGLFDRDISWDNPIDTGADPTSKYNHLIDRMMDVPEFRFYHCRRLTELMADEFSPAEMFPRIDETFAYIYDAAIADPNRWRPDELYGTPGFEDGPDELKTYVTNRIQFLEGEMTTFCPDLEVPLTVNEFLADNTSTVADEAGDYDDWIEIHNGSGTLAWDLGGMYLTDDLSDPTRWQVPTGTLVSPGGTLLFWADGEEGEGPLHTNFTLGAGGGQIGLFDRDVFGNAAISVLTYAAQTADTSYGRLPDGGETWQFFTAPTPGWLNRGHPPVISPAAHTPAWPTSSDTVTITTVITDEGAITATLWYRTFAAGAEPPDYQFAPMHPAGGSGTSWQLVLPAQTDGTWVEYYVEAQDEAGMVTVDRPGWPQGDYRYIVGWQRPPLYINELMALNTHTLEDGDGDHDDWIELYNGGPVDIDVGGMYLSDNIDQPDPEQLDELHIYQLPPGTTVPAGGFLLLWADGDGTGDHLSFKLSGAGEYVGLFDSEAGHYAPIDAVYFPPQTPDVSWGRFPDGSTGLTTSGDDAWHAMDIPTPGEPNLLLPPQFLEVTRTPLWPGAGEGVTVTAAITAGSPIVSATLWYDTGTGFQAAPMHVSPKPGFFLKTWFLDEEADVYVAQIPPQPEGTLVDYYLEAIDSIGQTTLHPPAAPTVTHRYLVGYAPPALLINEFLADNESINQDEAGEYDDWLELYNGSPITVTLDGMYLTDDLSEPTKWQFPASTTIPPGGHLLVWCDEDAGQGPLHANFKLNRDGEEIGLFADETHGNVPLDTIVFGPQQEDVSYGRRPDGSDTWDFLNPPTPGASNG